MSDNIKNTKKIVEQGSQVDVNVMSQKSAYGFYCGDCGDFVYEGYNTRSKKLPNRNAVCTRCGKKYENVQVA